MAGSHEDITDRKKAEEELHKSRERFELAVEGSQDGLYDFDLEAGRIHISPRAWALLGYNEHYRPSGLESWRERVLVVDDLPDDVVHPEDERRLSEAMKNCLEGRSRTYEVELRVRYKDGSYHWIRNRGVVLRGPTGKPYRIAGSFADIQAQKLAEEALRRQTNILNSILESLTDPVVVADENGSFVLWNQAAIQMVGVGFTDAPPEEWTKRYGCFVPGTETPYPTEQLPLIRAMRGETVQEAEVFMRNPDIPAGVLLSVNAGPLKDPEGALRGGVVVCRDISARKRAEEDLRASEERYRSVIAAMQDGIALLDTNGAIRACNSSAERILGLSAEQMMGRTPRDPRWRAILEDGSPLPDQMSPALVTLRTGQPCRDVVVGVHKPDGALTWISVNSQPLFQADGTTLSGVVVSFEVITERRNTEEALRQAKAELARLRGSDKPA
jgi:PAS domain S-box-containing protein